MTASAVVRRGRRVDLAAATVFVAAAGGLGLVLTAGAMRFDELAPAVLVAVVALPALALAALAAPWLAVAYVFLSIPVGDTDVPGLSVQVVQAVTAGGAAVVVLRRVAARQVPLDWAPPLWWFLAFVTWAVVALPSAADEALATRQVLLFGGELLFAALVVSACVTRADVRRVVGALLAVAALVATTTGGLSDVRSEFGGSVVTGRAQGVFNQPNELGTFAAIALLVAVGMALGGATRRSRRLATVVVVLTSVSLVLSLSRGAWIGAAAGLATLVVMLPEARRLLLLAGAPMLAAAFLLGSFAPATPEVQIVSERAKSILGERNPYDDRPNIWAEGRRQTLNDPWTGQGPGSFPVVAARSGSETVTFHPYHAHNLPLTFAAEMGLPATAFFVALAVAVGITTRRAHRQARAEHRARDSAVMAGLAAALVAVLAQGLIDYSLRSAVIFTEITGVLGALLAYTRARS